MLNAKVYSFMNTVLVICININLHDCDDVDSWKIQKKCKYFVLFSALCSIPIMMKWGIFVDDMTNIICTKLQIICTCKYKFKLCIFAQEFTYIIYIKFPNHWEKIFFQFPLIKHKNCALRTCFSTDIKYLCQHTGIFFHFLFYRRRFF